MEKNGHSVATLLRLKAENLIKNRPANSASNPYEGEILKLIHELEVYGVELELQNEEFIRSRRENEKTGNKHRISEEIKQRLNREIDLNQVELELQNEELKLSAATQEIANLYSDLFDFSTSGYLLLSKEGEIIDTNYSFARLIGKDRFKLKHSRFGFFVEENERTIYNDFLNSLFHHNTKNNCKLTLVLEDSRSLNVLLSGIPTHNDKQCLITVTDITPLKDAEAYREMKREILQILNESGDLKDTLHHTIDLIKQRTALDAVGIRLKDGQDFPYFDQSGFSDEFLLTENTLFEMDKQGNVCKDKNGNPLLGCTCGLVISGKARKSNPNFTSGGSWCTNDSSLVLKIPSQSEERFHSRNHCIHQGYQSIALIPIRNRDQIVGLIQCNSLYKHAFNDTLLVLLEGIASHIGSAMMRKQAEETLAFQAQLLSEVNDAVFSSDSNYTITYWNKASERIFGWATEEVLGKNSGELLKPQIKGSSRDQERSKLRNTGNWKGEVQYTRKDGICIFVDVNSTVLKDPTGKDIGNVVVARDITERKHAEQLMQESEARYRNLFDVMPSGVAVYEVIGNGRDFIFKDMNHAGERIDHVKKADIIGKSLYEMFPNVGEMGLDEVFRRVWQTGVPEFFPVTLYSDSKLVVWITNYVWRLPSGELVALFDDITEQKKAEDDLRKSENLYRAIGESIDYGIWICDANGKNTYASESYLKLVGMTHEECSNFGWGDKLHPDDAENTIAKWKECAKTGGKWDIEHRFKGVDGKWHPILARGIAMRDENGNITGWAGINLDISSIKQAEEELRQSEERYKSIFQNNHSVLLLINPNTGEITDANPSACTYYGWQHEELCSMNISEINMLTREEVMAEMQKAQVENKKHFHFRHRLSSNEIRDVEVYSGPVKYGETILLYSIIHDITDRKQAEEALQKNERLLKSVLNNVNSGVALIDESGQFTIFNPVFLRLFGIAEESTIKNVNDQNWADWQVFNEDGSLLNVDDHPVRKVALTGKRVDQQLVGVKLPTGGELFWMLISAEPILKKNGKIEKIICTYHDISRLKHTEKALRDSERRLDAVFNGVTETIMMMDIDGNILTANHTAANRWGMTIEELIGFNGFKYIPPDKKKQRESMIREMIESRAPIRFEDDSKGRIYDLTFYPVIENSGEINRFVVFNRDITEQKLAEKALMKSEKKLAELYASMSEGLAIHDLIFDTTGKAVDYVITNVNPAYENITGLNQNDVIGMKASVLYATGDAPYLDIYAQVESTGLSTSFETYFAPINRHFYISVFSPGKGQFVTVFRDITIQKQAEYALIKSEEKFSLIYEKSPYAISLCSPTDGRIEEVNKAFAKILGFSKEEITGKKTDELTIHIDAKKRKIIIEHFNRYGFVHDLEDIFYTKSGKPRILRYNIDSVELGNQKHILVTAENITASKKTELALREREFFFRETQKAAFIGSFKTIPNTGLWESSEVLDQIFGIDKSYVKNYEGWLSIIHPDDRIRINDYLRNEVFPKGVLADKEFRIIRKNDGQMRWVHALGRIEFKAKNKVSSMLGTIQDITARKQEEAALHKLNQTLTILSKSSQAMAQAMDEEEYLNEICNIIIEDNDFTSVWIGYAEDDKEKNIRSVASAGFSDNYLETIRMSWADNEYGSGPTGVAIQTGEMSVCSNMLTDPLFSPWRAHALKQGYASCISFPLKSGDTPFGAITIYSKEPDSFFTDEIKLLNKLAYDLVLGITTIRLKAENKLAEKELIKSHSLLEELVKERTTELMFANETLKLTEEKYHTVVDFATSWVYWLSPDDQVIYCSPSCKQVTGYTVDEFEDHSNLILDIIHPDDLQIYQEHKAMELHSNICAHDIRFRILRKDGMIRWISHHCQPVFDETGKSRGIRGSNRDITASKKMEELLKMNNRKFSLLSTNITDGIFIYKKDSFDYVNSAMSYIFGYSEYEFTSINLKQLVIKDNLDELEFIDQITAPISQIRNVELECIRKDKSTVFVEFLFNYVAKEKVIYGVAHDITDKKRIQKNILNAIIQTEEKERANFSKELHDGVGPLLSAIKLYLQWSERAKNEKSRQEIILKAEEILEETLVTAKEISNKLSPHLLTNHGLVSAIQSFIGKLEETSAIHISFEHHVSGRLTSEIEAALYRAIIECINNTIKYAVAKNIIIILNEQDNQIWVQYRDDGIGFDLSETLAAKKGLGLFNLQNRIQNIGGKITLYSEPGKGVDYQIIIDI